MARAKHRFDLIVLGSGAGGGVGASLAASWGRKVAIFERDAIGGECPNWACIPTKALLQTAEVYQTALGAGTFGVKTGKVSFDPQAITGWKDLVVSRTGAAEGASVFTDEGITVVEKEARFISPHEVEAGDEIYWGKRFLVATGTDNFIPPIPGLKEAGYLVFRDAIDLRAYPQSLFIIGGGPIGCEFAQIFSSLGVKVYVAEALPRLLIKDEPEVGDLIKAIFESRGVEVLTGCTVSEVEKRGAKRVVHYQAGHYHHSVTVDQILVAAGKQPTTSGGLEQARIKYDRHGIKVNRYMRTSTPHIYAAGDVVGPYQFTHTAAYQSQLAVNNMYRLKKIKADYAAVPRCVFTAPEVASVGITEQEADQQRIPVRTGITPIGILGRANTVNESNGFVKVVTNRKGVILGGAIVSPRAGEMIHELTLAVKFRLTARQIADTIHAFPTFSEAVKMACENALA